jgi:hypothetical protein
MTKISPRPSLEKRRIEKWNSGVISNYLVSFGLPPLRGIYHAPICSISPPDAMYPLDKKALSI